MMAISTGVLNARQAAMYALTRTDDAEDHTSAIAEERGPDSAEQMMLSNWPANEHSAESSAVAEDLTIKRAVGSLAPTAFSTASAVSAAPRSIIVFSI